ncbi:hypothetical protein GCM10010458_05270 [Microbacterium luteolum]|uniref:DDE-type integrase/transposase/recombinase n=1 Tax=Microbacterium luteolum TaxID=69367 RepID=A0ABY7XQR9_MICLT|nr:Mu transposase C-terminal domain-containing protein [Microbacterium luteolum]WDM43327.1 DDE-type integrase/transposase/recombinase [Microbacterium luteolum]
MNVDLGSVAELARLSPAERARCKAIERVIQAADSDQASETESRAERVRQAFKGQLGIDVSQRQVYRYLASYRLGGVAALADARKTGKSRATKTDPRVFGLIESELKDQLEVSTGTRSRTIARVKWAASRQGVPVPSTRTMYRLLEQLDRHRGSFGSATTRRSKAVRPDRTFRPSLPSRPGELVEIDSTPLDLFVQMPDGSVGRPELTYAIDVATGTIGATLLHERAAKSVDIGAVLLTRMLTRIVDQPWWGEAVSFAETVFEPTSEPLGRVLEEAAAVVPLIVPEAVTVDRGKVFVGSTFTAACERLEISQVRANPRQGTDKPHVEGGFKRIRDGFVQYLAGYSGGHTQNRGDEPRTEAVWTLGEVRLLLDLWVIVEWQTTAQSGLRLPGMPQRALSPNQMYAALSAAAPHVPVSLGREDYIALLPLAWRSVQPYGLNFGGLVYDAEALHPMRGRQSGLSGEARGRWEIRYDPYNLRQIWVRDIANSRWITASWALAARTDHPFSREVLRAAQRAITEPSHPTTIDILEQINRIQAQRVTPQSGAPPFKKSRVTKGDRPTPVVELRAGGSDSRAGTEHAEGTKTRAALPHARLRLLE